jgi:integrase
MTGNTTTTRARDNGEGEIRERKDGTFEARLRIGNGERRSFYGKTKKEVRDKLNAARRDYEAGRLAKDPARKVGGFLDEWLTIRRRSIAPSTYDNYALNITRLRPHLGQHHLTALRHTHIEQCYEALRADMSETSVHQAHRVLRITLRHAVKCRYIPHNPLDLVATPKPPHKEMRTLDAEQVEALLSATRDHRLHPMWVLLVTTGLRSGEATALTWD